MRSHCNPIYWWGSKKTNFNPIYVCWDEKVLSWGFKNVSFIYVELVKSGLDMTESCGCKMGMDILKLVWVFVGGHSNNLVRPWEGPNNCWE